MMNDREYKYKESRGSQKSESIDLILSPDKDYLSLWKINGYFNHQLLSISTDMGFYKVFEKVSIVWYSIVLSLPQSISNSSKWCEIGLILVCIKLSFKEDQTIEIGLE